MPMFKAGIIEYTWANKPAIAPLGQIICITDVGENGSLWRGNGTKWVCMHSVRYYDLAAAVSVTGTTAETVLSTITVKGGLMGANGKLKIWPLIGCTNNANNKTMYIKAGGTTFFAPVYTNAAVSVQFLGIIRNINSASSQIAHSSTSQSGVTLSSTAPTAASINTASDFTLAISAQLGNAGDTFTLHGLFVEVI